MSSSNKDNETVAYIASMLELVDTEHFFIAQRLRAAHGRETQKLRERIDKLVNQLHENGLEEEDGK